MTSSHWLPQLFPPDFCHKPSHLLPLKEDMGRLSRLQPAAVLVPVIREQQEAALLLTRRADHLSRHAGQVAFPGGKVEDGDASLQDTAIRETFEETGIARDFIKPLGFLPPCKTGTGYCVFPLVAELQSGFVLKPDPSEVASIFEVPLNFLMLSENHHKKTVFWQGQAREFYDIPYQGHNIWGLTAEIIRNLYDINQ